MQIKTTLRFHIIPVRKAKINNTHDSTAYRRVTMEINSEVSYKIRNQSTLRPNYTTLGHTLKVVPSCQEGTCSTMFIFALFIINRYLKYLRCPSTEECTKNMWYIYTME